MKGLRGEVLPQHGVMPPQEDENAVAAIFNKTADAGSSLIFWWTCILMAAGTLPANFAKLDQMVYIDMRGNRLSGMHIAVPPQQSRLCS